MRVACPACGTIAQAGDFYCPQCGVSLADRDEHAARPASETRHAPEPAGISEPIPVTRKVPRPQSPPVQPTSPARPDSPPRAPRRFPKSNNPHFQAWLELADTAPDGTCRFRPQRTKPLFALVAFGQLGLPAESRILRSAQTVLGREEGDVQVLNDPAVSGRHAQLVYREDLNLVLSDLGSTNGTFFKLRPRQMFKLWDGCQIIVGRQILTFSAAAQGSSPAQKPARAQTAALSTLTKDPVHGRLVLATDAGREDREYPLAGRTVLGRAKDKAQIVFAEDDFLSPAHAAVEFSIKLQQVVIHDLNSINGVFVQIRQGLVLEDGDVFRLGEQVFGVVVV